LFFICHSRADGNPEKNDVAIIREKDKMKNVSGIMSIKATDPILKTHMLTKVLLLSYLPINILIALLTPSNILDYSWARSFADFTAHFIPLVAKIGKTSTMPELYFTAAAINLIAIIFTILIISFFLALDRNYFLNSMTTRQYSKKDKIKIIFWIPFSVIGFRLILFDFQRSEYFAFGIHHMISSKLVMGIYGSFLFGVWFLLGISLVFNYYLYVLLKHNFQVKEKP
jgi:hypothetical protein